MTISRKPVTEKGQVDVDTLIERGGSAPQRTQVENKEDARPVYVQLRIPKNIVAQIDGNLSTRPIRKPRHTWLLEAIHDKLSSERDK